PFAARTQSAFRSEMALPGHEVHLDPDASGIFEQDRVVAGSEPPVLRRGHDLRTQLVDDQRVHRIDGLSAPRPEAQGVQARAPLIEGSPVLRLRIGSHEDTGAPPDAVDDLVGVDQRLHVEEVAQLLPERDAGRVPHRELDVRDAVDLDAHGDGALRTPTGDSSVGPTTGTRVDRSPIRTGDLAYRRWPRTPAAGSGSGGLSGPFRRAAAAAPAR